MIGSKVVVKFQNGKIIKGRTADFGPNKKSVHLHTLKEYGDKVLNIKLSLLKAVFFVKDFKGDKNYKKVRTFEGQPKGTPSERKIIVNFKDGEKLYGTCHSYNPKRKGFFVYPIDPKDNNERIFVIVSAIESVKLQKYNSEDFQTYVYKKM